MDGETVLELRDIVVRFEARTVLGGITAEIKTGEFVGLIGQNGAGKTTLLHVILGLRQPNGGKVSVAGQSRNQKNRFIGYVPQKIHLEPDIPLRGRDLVGLGLYGHRFGIPLPSRARRQRIEEMLDAVGASHLADSPVGKISGGELQRLLIAQALLTSPKVLLLDEPLSNLDIRSTHEVVRLLSRICKETGVAVVLVAHDMNPLLGSMDKILYLAGGHGVMGRVDKVIRPDVLSRLYGYPIDVLHTGGRVLVVEGTDRAGTCLKVAGEQYGNGMGEEGTDS